MLYILFACIVHDSTGIHFRRNLLSHSRTRKMHRTKKLRVRQTRVAFERAYDFCYRFLYICDTMPSTPASQREDSQQCSHIETLKLHNDSHMKFTSSVHSTTKKRNAQLNCVLHVRWLKGPKKTTLSQIQASAPATTVTVTVALILTNSMLSKRSYLI